LIREILICYASGTYWRREISLTGIQIFKFLPGTNCKKCGAATCLAFAMNLATGKIGLDACPDVSPESRKILSAASALPIFYASGTDRRPQTSLTGIQIFKLLPGTNCKKCGAVTCLAFAMNLATGKIELGACPDVSPESRKILSAASAPPIFYASGT
jgi:ArsR family metal-binding transcriptional regulator